jgi:hypothetical protein
MEPTLPAVALVVETAEGVGFEPTVPGLPIQRFSRPPDSTTLAPLRGATVEGSDHLLDRKNARRSSAASFASTPPTT